jgi:hypothetical protein
MFRLEFAAMRKNSCELKKDVFDILAPGNIAHVEESQIGDVGNQGVTAVDFVRGFHEDRERRIHLFVNISPLHIQAGVRRYADDLNIQLHFMSLFCSGGIHEAL